MSGRGIQHLPLGRIPRNWDPAWFANFIKEVLALADARNSIGEGLDITGNPDQVATFSVNADIQDLLEQTFILAQPSGFLEFERTLAGESGVIQILDGGPDANITVALIDNGVSLGKLRTLSDMGVLGNPVDAVGAVQNIQAELDGDVLTRQGTDLVFTSTPIWTGTHNWLDGIAATWGTDDDLSISHSGSAGTIANGTGNLEITSAGGFTVNGETLAEIAQDAVGTILTDSDTIDFTYNDGTPAISAEVIESYAYEWTANHRWADNDEVQLGTGGDLRLFHDGTNSYIRNDTGTLAVSMAGTTRLLIGTDGKLDITSDNLQPMLVSGTVNGSQTFQATNASNGTANAARISFSSGDANAAFFVAGSGRTSALITGGPVGAQAAMRTLGAYPLLFGVANTYVGAFDNDSTARNTRLLIYDVDNGQVERVSVGIADSGGAGFKLLRIPN